MRPLFFQPHVQIAINLHIEELTQNLDPHVGLRRQERFELTLRQEHYLSNPFRPVTQQRLNLLRH